MLKKDKISNLPKRMNKPKSSISHGKKKLKNDMKKIKIINNWHD